MIHLKRRNKHADQQGVILILTLFVVLITFALVTQLTIGTSVAHQTAKNSANRTQLEYAAGNAGEEILRILADDMPTSGGEEAGSGLDGLAGADPGATSGQDPSAGLGGDGEEGEEEEDDGSNSDSFEDEWSRPARFTIEDIEVHAFVQDENSKMNVLTLFDADEEVREEARDRFVRILDYLREDMEDDLDPQAANLILEDLIAWVEGDSRDLEYPAPLRHSTSRFMAVEEEAASDGEGAQEDADEPVASTPEDIYLPYSLEEFLLLEHVDEELFYDQLRRNDEIAPGLESVFTVYTSLSLDPPETESPGEDALGEDGDASGEGFEGADPDAATDEESSSLSNPEGGLDDLLNAGAGLGTLLNINTMHPAVLRGLLPSSEIPEFILESILEYRNEVDEEALAEADNEEVDYDELELRRSIYREDHPEPHRYFRNLDDLLEVDGWEDRLDPEQASKFQSLIGVQSDIFSIYLWCRIQPSEWEQEHYYEEPPGPVLRMKAVVWRRSGEDGAKFIFIEPWHEVPYTRWRIPDFQQDLPVYEEPEF